MRIVSARVSPLDVEVALGSEKPTTSPPRRIMAVWKEKFVRVLGSKNREAMTLPLQERLYSFGRAIISQHCLYK
jgi:hypothetical protein